MTTDPAAAVDPHLVHLLAYLTVISQRYRVNMAHIQRGFGAVLARVTQLAAPAGGIAGLASSLGVTPDGFCPTGERRSPAVWVQFTEADLVAIHQLLSARSDGGRWNDLDAAVAQVRGDDPDRPMGKIAAAHERLLIDAMRELDRDDYTVADLRQRVGSALVRLTKLIQDAGGILRVVRRPDRSPGRRPRSRAATWGQYWPMRSRWRMAWSETNSPSAT